MKKIITFMLWLLTATLNAELPPPSEGMFQFSIKACHKGDGFRCYQAGNEFKRRGKIKNAEKYLKRSCLLKYEYGCILLENMNIRVDSIDPGMAKAVLKHKESCREQTGFGGPCFK